MCYSGIIPCCHEYVIWVIYMAKKDNDNLHNDNLNIKGLGVISWFIIISIGTFLFFVSSFAILILVLGMSPTIVASVTDKRYGSCASRTVGAMNFMGILPFLFDLLKSSDPAVLAKELATTPSVWLSIYGCAFMGWVIIWVVPQITAAIFNVRAENKVENITKLQEVLVQEWGPEIKEGLSDNDFLLNSKNVKP